MSSAVWDPLQNSSRAQVDAALLAAHRSTLSQAGAQVDSAKEHVQQLQNSVADLVESKAEFDR